MHTSNSEGAGDSSVMLVGDAADPVWRWPSPMCRIPNISAMVADCVTWSVGV